MQALKIIQLRPDIWALDEVAKTVMYVVNGSEKVMLVDTGFGLSDLKQVICDLCGEEQDGKKVLTKEIVVVNSHGHPDHDYGNNQFDAVYAGRFDEPGMHEEIDPEQSKLLTGMFFAQFLNEGGTIEKWAPGPAPRVLPLQDDDILDLGNYQFRVIEIPGHSLGSIALFEEKEGWLFTGDAMLTWEVWGQLDNSATLSVYGDSMRKLQKIESQVTTVFPAHWVPERASADMTPYELPPRVITVYAEGIQDTIDGRLEWKDYPFGLGDTPKKMMKASYFEIGGIAFDPKRLGK